MGRSASGADVASLVSTYLAERCALGELVPSSAKVIGPVLRQWLRFAGAVPPARWTPELVAAWVNPIHLKPSTRKSRLTKLRPFCQWLVDQDVITKDPTRKLRRIAIPDGNPRDLTPEEITAVYRAAPDERGRLIVLLLAHLGLRCGDLARVRVEDIDVRRRSIHVRAKGGGGEPTHWSPVPDEAWDALVRWVRSQGLRHGPLLRSYQNPERGLEPASVGVLVTRWLYDTGVKQYPRDGITPHSFRHAFAQQLIDADVPLRLIQTGMGHASIRSTELYTRREPPGLREAMEGRSYVSGPRRIDRAA